MYAPDVTIYPFPSMSQISAAAFLGFMCSALKFPSITIVLAYFQLSRCTLIACMTETFHSITYWPRSAMSPEGTFNPGWGHAGQNNTSCPGPGLVWPSWNPCHFKSFNSLHILDTLSSSLYRSFCVIFSLKLITLVCCNSLVPNAGMRWM